MHVQLRRPSETTRRAHRRSCRRGPGPLTERRSRPKSRAERDYDARSAGAQAAAAGVKTIPADLRFYVVNAPGTQAYPITGYSWVIVYQKQGDGEKGKALAQLLWWMIHDGQKYAEPLGYALLPSNIVTKGEVQIRSTTCGASTTSCLT